MVSIIRDLLLNLVCGNWNSFTVDKRHYKYDEDNHQDAANAPKYGLVAHVMSIEEIDVSSYSDSGGVNFAELIINKLEFPINFV